MIKADSIDLLLRCVPSLIGIVATCLRMSLSRLERRPDLVVWFIVKGVEAQDV